MPALDPAPGGGGLAADCAWLNTGLGWLDSMMKIFSVPGAPTNLKLVFLGIWRKEKASTYSLKRRLVLPVGPTL